VSVQRARASKPSTRAGQGVKPASWSDAVDRFMNSLDHAGRSSHTTHHYRDDLRAFATWWAETSAEALSPTAITDYDLREWKRHLREEKLDETGRTRKPATINAKLAAVKSFLHWAVRAKVITAAPEAPRREKLGNRRVKWLDAREQRQLLRQAARDRNPRNLAMVEILIETGLRVAEFVALRWELDVKLSERKGSVNVRAGKGCKPRGPLPLSPIARKAFQRLRELDPDAAPGEPAITSQRLDPARDGRRRPLTPRGVQELLGRYAAKLRWDGLHPHQLRHTCAVNMRNRGVDWPTIAAYLGHSSVKTTMDNYATPSPRDLEAAVAGSAVDGDDFE
jgi:site-specific recombinase XerD